MWLSSCANPMNASIKCTVKAVHFLDANHSSFEGQWEKHLTSQLKLDEVSVRC